MSTDVHHPCFARLWPPLSRALDRRGAAAHRERLLSGARGRVLEVGAGNGRNFAHYPTTVTSVLAVEPEPHLRALAQQEASRVDVDVEVVAGVAEHLPADDDAFDVVVASLVLCTVDDPGQALAEAARVLRPGGQLRFLEHVAAPTTGLRRVQRVMDATVWPHLGGGCHAGRDTLQAIERAGFTIAEVDHFRFPETRVPLPTSPHVLGTASPAAG